MQSRELLLARYGRYARIVRLVVSGRWEEVRGLWQPDDFDGENSFCSFAGRQHLAHYILRRIETERIDVPPALVLGLGRAAERGRARTELIPAALTEVATAFAAAEIDCLLLKGLPFSARYFGDPRARQVYDVDVLVRRADADRGLRALLGLGFEPKQRRVREGKGGPSIRPHRLRTEHALGLRRGKVNVDLHWRLRTAPAYRLPEEAAWSDAQEIAIGATRCRAPSDEYALVLLLLSIAHDIGRSAGRMKHLLDVYQLLRSTEMDWERFFERRREENTLGISVNVLGAVVDILGGAAELPRLVAALRRHEALRVAPKGRESMLLLFRSGRRIANALWFARIYPAKGPRDAFWLVDRYLSHPGRLLLLPWTLVRACYWSARHLIGPARAPA